MNTRYAIAGLSLLLLPAYAFAELLSVQVEQAPIRSKPSFVGQILTNVPYQQQVEILQIRGDWRMVRFGEHQGWMHVKALQQSRTTLQPGSGIVDSGVSSREVSLAGKGFNAEIENAYRSSHGNLGYAWVDKMEGMHISSTELEAFAAESDFVTTAR